MVNQQLHQQVICFPSSLSHTPWANTSTSWRPHVKMQMMWTRTHASETVEAEIGILQFFIYLQVTVSGTCCISIWFTAVINLLYIDSMHTSYPFPSISKQFKAKKEFLLKFSWESKTSKMFNSTVNFQPFQTSTEFHSCWYVWKSSSRVLKLALVI